MGGPGGFSLASGGRNAHRHRSCKGKPPGNGGTQSHRTSPPQGTGGRVAPGRFVPCLLPGIRHSAAAAAPAVFGHLLAAGLPPRNREGATPCSIIRQTHCAFVGLLWAALARAGCSVPEHAASRHPRGGRAAWRLRDIPGQMRVAKPAEPVPGRHRRGCGAVGCVDRLGDGPPDRNNNVVSSLVQTST